MDGKRFIHSLRIQNLLSFGSEGSPIELQPLNVLIGANASGKSNLIEIIRLLRAAPTNLAVPIREGGGISDWLWKGLPSKVEMGVGSIEVIARIAPDARPLRYLLGLMVSGPHMIVAEELLQDVKPDLQPGSERNLLTHRPLSVAALRTRPGEAEGTVQEFPYLDLEIGPDQSALRALRDPLAFPEITRFSRQLAAIQIYSDWHLGRQAPLRQPQLPDRPDDFLEEADARNLGLILNALEHDRTVWQEFLSKLQLAYPDAEAVTTRIQGGTVQIFLHERGLKAPVPATRLSDGTLRYLCLLAVLLHPNPPSLICLEEPELGLHPDLMLTIAQLLLDAAQRTQLIVTTHSSGLISGLSSTPEGVVVCERDDRGSRFQRLEADQLKPWLERYALGEIWQMGEIGGNRW